MATALAIAPDGTLCIDKTGPADVIAAQAEILAGLDVAGLPTVLAQLSADCLRLRHAGRHTLATWSAPSPRDRAAVVAAVADTVDALHEAGVVHGAIRPDHVVIAGNGAPVLVGLSSARRVSNPSALSSAAPPVERRDDIDALGRLCVTTAADTAAPGAGLARFLRNRRDDASAELHRMAERISAGRFDSARGVASALRESFGLDTADNPTRAALGLGPARPTAVQPPADADTATDQRWSAPLVPRCTDRRPGAMAAAALGACCVVGAGIAVAMGIGGLTRSSGEVAVDGPLSLPAQDSAGTGTDAPPQQSTGTDAPPHQTGTGTDAPPHQTATGTDAPPQHSAAASPSATPGCLEAGRHDVDGDGCSDDVVIEAGGVVVDGALYAVGLPGDELVVGDWDCDGTATLALVRAGTGEVWVFAAWPQSEPLTATLATALSPPVQATVVTSPAEGCDALVVRGDGEMWSSADS